MLQTGVCPAGTDVNDCSSSSGASTPLTNANILAAVDACLAEDPINMVCPNTEYGDAADWDVGGVTDFSYALSTFSNRPGGGAASTQFVNGAVFALTWGARQSRIAPALSLPHHASAPRRWEYFLSSRRSA